MKSGPLAKHSAQTATQPTPFDVIANDKESALDCVHTHVLNAFVTPL